MTYNLRKGPSASASLSSLSLYLLNKKRSALMQEISSRFQVVGEKPDDHRAKTALTELVNNEQRLSNLIVTAIQRILQ